MKERGTILEREVEIVGTQTRLSLSLSRLRYSKDFTASTEAGSANSEKTWLPRLKLLEFYMHVTRSFSRKFFTTTSTLRPRNDIHYTLFSVTYRNARWRALVYPVTGLFLSSAGATTDPGPPLSNPFDW